MSEAEYEKKFLELLEFFPYLIPNNVIKKRRFLNGLSDVIALGILRVAHPTSQYLRDITFEVERQRIMGGSRQCPYVGIFFGTSS